MKKFIPSIVTFILLISCVSQSEYDKVKLENIRLQNEIYELKNGAIDRLNMIIYSFEAKEYSQVLILSDSLNQLYPSSIENDKAKEFKTKSQKAIDEIEKNEKAEREKRNKHYVENQKENAREIIRISRYYASRPNSASGVDISIVWQNKAKKTVKYATFEVLPYNGVGDVVKCSIRDNTYFTGQVTGPIKSGAWYGNNTQWSNAWYNSTIKKIKLTEIKIEYMDGTKESLYGDNIEYVVY